MHACIPGLSETFETGKINVICCNVHMQWKNKHTHPPTTLYNKDTATTKGLHDECIIIGHVQVHLKKIEYHEKGHYFLSLISESETHILYRFIMHSEIFKSFISWHFDDYGLQIMKTQNSVSQNFWILHKINIKGYFKQMNILFRSLTFLCNQYLVGPPFAWITALMQRGMETISLWHCWGVMKAQVSLIAAFRSSALLGLVSLIFLLAIPHRESSLLANQAH